MLIWVPSRKSFIVAYTRSWSSLVIAVACPAANAALTVIDTKYHEDLMFPEFNCYWEAASIRRSVPAAQGSHRLCVCEEHRRGSATITDATLAGYSLHTVIKRSTASWNPNDLNSIYFNWDNPPADILAAGEPVWWKADPPTIPAGGVGQVAVRLRYVPTTPTVTVGVTSGAR